MPAVKVTFPDTVGQLFFWCSNLLASMSFLRHLEESSVTPAPGTVPQESLWLHTNDNSEKLSLGAPSSIWKHIQYYPTYSLLCFVC